MASQLNYFRAPFYKDAVLLGGPRKARYLENFPCEAEDVSEKPEQSVIIVQVPSKHILFLVPDLQNAYPKPLNPKPNP